MTEILHLSTEFPPVSTEAWEAAISKDLKGADYEKKLVWRTEEGLAVRPYYRREALHGLEGQLRGGPGHYPFARGMGRGWEIAQNAKPGPKAIRVDLLHEAGAHAVQELGYGIAMGVERLAELTATLPVDTVAPQIEFVFAVGPSYFVEIAKLRAARLLWSQAVTAFGGADCRMRLHVRTPRRNKSVYDQYTNLLRVTTEAFSAVVGGCDQLTVEAFGFDEHLALNVQRILKEEARLDAVADPGGGSYFVEALTDSLGRAGWALFQATEALGGYSSALGSVEIALRESREARAKAYSSRRRVLVGVNNFPDVGEGTRASILSPQRRDAETQRKTQRTQGESKSGDGAGLLFQRRDAENAEKNQICGLPRVRVAEVFEGIRGGTVANAARSGRVPVVLLLKRGDVKMKGARANFCFNFFGCAGFDLKEAEEYRGIDADLIVLCSSDGEYLQLAREVCPAVSVPVIVAGNPKDQTASLTAAGVSGFVHVGSDLVETLTYWQERLGMRCTQ